MLGTDILEGFLEEDKIVPRRKYGRLRKTVEVPPKGNCSRCRSGKFCPIEGHFGQDVQAKKDWTGPSKIQKRTKSSS